MTGALRAGGARGHVPGAQITAASVVAIVALVSLLAPSLAWASARASLLTPGIAHVSSTHHHHHQPPLQAFLLTSAPDSLEDLQAHARSVGVVYPTYFDCQIPSGRVLGHAVASVTAYGRARHIAMMPRFNCQDGPTVHRILTEPGIRAATLARLHAIASSRSYRGLCVDFENDGSEDRAALTSFVTELAQWLHSHHKRLSVVVAGVSEDNPRMSTGFYDDRALSAVADNLFVMAWGTHWAGSEPGPIAPLSYVQAVARYVASLPNASRFVLGAPMYGLDWSAGASEGKPAEQATAYQYSGIATLLHEVHTVPSRDPASAEMTFSYTTVAGVPHRVWYMDAHTVAVILRIGRASGLQVGLWRLGREDQKLWSSTTVTG